MAALPERSPAWLWLAPVAVLLAWLPSLAGPFQFDDYNVIVGYAPVHSLAGWWQSLPGIRPLLKLSYALNWSLSPSPWGFHLANLAIHALNACLLWLWLGRAAPFPPVLRLLAVCLWALHPAQTEAVTYIAGRSVSLSTTGLLAGLWLLAGTHRHRAGLAAGCTLLALGVRETAWIFPAAFALGEWLRGQAGREVWRSVRPSLLVVLAALGLFLVEPHARRLVEVSFATRGPGAQFLGQLEALRYFVTGPLSLTPNLDPDLLPPPGLTPALAAWGLGLAGLLGLAMVRTLRDRSWCWGGLLWCFLLLAPTNSFMPRLDLASDRHLYPALAGLACALTALLQPLRHGRLLLAALLPLILVALLIRNEDYRSELALWARTAAQSPDKSRVWNNLGVACQRAGDRACAREAFERAWALDPDNGKAAANLYFLDQPPPGPPPPRP